MKKIITKTGLIALLILSFGQLLTGQTNTDPTQTVCAGTEPYSVTSATGSAYDWAITPGTSGTQWKINGTGNSITVDWKTAGVYTLSVVETSSLGCTGSPKQVVVTVKSKPVATATPSSQSISSGSATSIALSGSSGTTTFTWTAALTSGTASGFSSGSGSTIAQTLTNTTANAATVSYTITPADNGCTGSPITVVVTVNPQVTVIATPSSEAICSGDATNITLTSNIGTATFTWTAALTGGSATGFSGGSGNKIAQTLTNSSTSPATVTYTVTPTDSGHTGAPITVVITVNPLPLTSPISHN